MSWCFGLIKPWVVSGLETRREKLSQPVDDEVPIVVDVPLSNCNKIERWELCVALRQSGGDDEGVASKEGVDLLLRHGRGLQKIPVNLGRDDVVTDNRERWVGIEGGPERSPVGSKDGVSLVLQVQDFEVGLNGIKHIGHIPVPLFGHDMLGSDESSLEYAGRIFLGSGHGGKY